MAYSNVTPPALPELGSGKVAYNGVQLPNIDTVWTGELKKTHPYAFCYKLTDSILWLYLTSSELYFDADSYLNHETAGSHIQYTLSSDRLTWGTGTTGTHKADQQFSTYGPGLIWSNFDVLASDGSVYLAASDPVPIQPYPYYVLVYDYSEGTEDWYQAHLFASATAFVWDGEKITNPGGETLRQVYDDETGWLDLGTATPNITPGLDGNVYQRVYTNHDILDAEGNVWLAAGAVTPVEEETKKFPLKSWLMGLALALEGKPRLLAKREPVAWLYNGVRLPGIESVYTKEVQEEFPFAVIRKSTSTTSKYWLYLSDQPSTHETQILTGELVITITGYGGGYRLVDDVWELSTELGTQLSRAFPVDETAFLWVNHDILNEDNTIYLAASEPVPVYE